MIAAIGASAARVLRGSATPRRRVGAGVWCALAACLTSTGPLSGCLERTIKVTSEPPGALVTINDVEAGRTPLSTSFDYYGTFDVQVRKDGFETISGPARARAPIYESPPLDLGAIALPTRIKTERAWHYTLTPVSSGDAAADEAALVDRARQLREHAGGPR